MIPLALFLLPFSPKPFRHWLMGIALGRKPERIDDWDEEAWQAKQARALEKTR